MNTDFAVHTRETCNHCANNNSKIIDFCTCKCVRCQGDMHLCGLGLRSFPMLTSCKWNTILECANYKEIEND